MAGDPVARRDQRATRVDAARAAHGLSALRRDRSFLAGKMRRRSPRCSATTASPSRASRWSRSPGIRTSLKPRAIALTFAKGPGPGCARTRTTSTAIPRRETTRAWATWRSPRRVGVEVRAALRLAERHRPISDDQALALFQAEGGTSPPCAVADGLREEAVGDVVTYATSTGTSTSRTCATWGAGSARSLSARSIPRRTRSRSTRWPTARPKRGGGASEVCMQGIHPDLPDVLPRPPGRGETARPGDPRVHAFSPMEVLNGATGWGVLPRVPECVPGARARDDPRDGGGDPRRRGAVAPHQGEAAGRHLGGDRPHGPRPGVRSSSTIMFGHVDAPPHWVAHLRHSRGSSSTRAGSPSSSRSRSSIATPRSTSRGMRAPVQRSRTASGCTRSPASCSTARPRTSRSRG